MSIIELSIFLMLKHGSRVIHLVNLNSRSFLQFVRIICDQIMAKSAKRLRFWDQFIQDKPTGTNEPSSSSVVVYTTNPDTDKKATRERKLGTIEAFYKANHLNLDELNLSLTCRADFVNNDSQEIYWDSSTLPYPPGYTKVEVVEIMKEMYWELGSREVSKRNFEEALVNFQKAVNLDKCDMISFINVADVFCRLRRYEDCIDPYLKAITIGAVKRDKPSLLVKAYLNVARAYGKLSNVCEYSVYKSKYLKELEKIESKSEA